MSAELAKSPPKFFSKSVVKFGTEVIATGDSAKTRDDVRSSEQKIGRKGTGIGFDDTDDNEIA